MNSLVAKFLVVFLFSILSLFLPKPTELDKSWLDAKLISAAKVGIYREMQRDLNQGANPNARDQYGNTALFFSVFNDDVEHAELLIAAGADVRIKNKSGETPLHIAFNMGHKGMVKMLISNGAFPK